VRFHGEHYEFKDTIAVMKVKNVARKDTSIITYELQADTVTYLLVDNPSKSARISSRYSRDSILTHVLDTVVVVRGDSYKVRRYVANEFIMDGAYSNYYTSKFGFFAVHSETWEGLKLLQTADSADNYLIRQLAKSIVPRYFLRGEMALESNK
jgi:hypothetical protein